MIRNPNTVEKLIKEKDTKLFGHFKFDNTIEGIEHDIVIAWIMNSNLIRSL